MDEQDQDPFDLFVNCIKTEPEIGTSETIQNKYPLRKPKTFKIVGSDVLSDTKFNDFDYQPMRQFATVEIKGEMIECETLQNERHLEWPTKDDQSTFSENVPTVSKIIKQELEKFNDEVTDLKQEVSEYIIIQPKTENVVGGLLTSECDLPTLKIESNDYFLDNYWGHSRKALKNTSPVILKKKKRIYICPICQNNFPSSKSRSTHIDGHFKKRFAVCQFCGRIMKKIEFFQHVFNHVVKNRMKNNDDDRPLKCNLSPNKLNRKNINDVDDKSFECGICFKTFHLKSKLQRHLIVHSDEKPFKCDICSKCFNRKYTLQTHLIIHSDKKPFKCDICPKRFNRKCSLQNHLIIHSYGKPFKCDICLKSFINKGTLKQHLIVHSGAKPFECDICTNRFNDKSTLLKHLLIHSGKKPFKCSICSKGFTRKPHLQQHLLMHTGEKPFKCNICLKDFTQKPHLQQHLLIHSGEKPFKCEICCKQFRHKSSLRTHLKSLNHSNEKTFKCDICSKGFTRKYDLQKHLIIHSGEKPFKCDICSKYFNYKCNLRKHLINHTS